jgi:hypothetical protein
MTTKHQALVTVERFGEKEPRLVWRPRGSRREKLLLVVDRGCDLLWIGCCGAGIYCACLAIGADRHDAAHSDFAVLLF